jgi:hypothetical protein
MANYPQIPGVDAMGRPLSQEAMAKYAGVKLNNGAGGGGGGGVGGGGVVGGGGRTPLDTLKYKAKRTIPQNMPMGQVYPAFAPGALDQLAAQMQAGFGAAPAAGQPAANPFMPYLQNMFKDTSSTILKEPISQTYRSVTNKDGDPKKGFQQYGYSTGSSYLDKLFGIVNNIPQKKGVV